MKNMTFSSYRWLTTLVLVAIQTILTGCTVVSPDPGEVGVLVDKPWIAGHEGVRDQVVQTGRTYTWASTDVIKVSIVPQVVKVSFDDFSSMDNIFLDFETTIQFRVLDGALLIKQFGPDWFHNNIQAQYGSIVRDAVKRHDMKSMISDPATAAAVDKEVTDAIRAWVASQKIPVEIINVSLGRAKPNQQVLTQMNDTAAQQQRLLTLVAATEAEKQRKAEQEARADADNAYRNKLGLDTTQYTAIQLATINADACKAAKECIIVPEKTLINVANK